jgi:hypothetical protein
MSKSLEHVYCFRVGSRNCFKVGRTKSTPEKRKRNVSTGSFEKLSVYRDIPTEDASSLETYILHLLDEKRAENGDFFHVTEEELNSAVDEAVSFFAEFQPLRGQAEAMKSRIPRETMAKPSGEALQIHRELREQMNQRYFIQQRIELLEAKIKVAIGDESGMQGVASWKWVEQLVFDRSKFKMEHPELYQRYIRNGGHRTFLVDRIETDGEAPVEELMAIADGAAAHVERPYLDHAELLYDEHGLPK